MSTLVFMKVFARLKNRASYAQHLHRTELFNWREMTVQNEYIIVVASWHRHNVQSEMCRIPCRRDEEKHNAIAARKTVSHIISSATTTPSNFPFLQPRGQKYTPAYIQPHQLNSPFTISHISLPLSAAATHFLPRAREETASSRTPITYVRTYVCIYIYTLPPSRIPARHQRQASRARVIQIDVHIHIR